MSDYIKVVPTDGMKVLHPDTLQPLPVEGKRVRMAPYWERMERQGAVSFEMIKDEKAEAPKPEVKPEAPATEVTTPKGDKK